MATLRPISELARSAELLLPPTTITVPNAVAYSNILSVNPRFGAHLLNDVYAARRSEVAGVSLVALPQGATVLGGPDYLLHAGGIFAKEQYPFWLPDNDESRAEFLDSRRPVEDIGGEALLIARFGVGTWGHWLGELLPKAVLAETLYPGRFSFAVPWEVFDPALVGSSWIRMRESLAAYGIGKSRIVPMDSERDYRFSALFAVTPVWSVDPTHPEAPDLMHPGAAAVMRTELRARSEALSPRRLAIQRMPDCGRELDNFPEIAKMLRAAGFKLRMAGTMPFLKQVALFREADLVFGVLGSDLTGLLFAPDGVKVITAAPSNFGDAFFYALILERQGRQIDLRGPITRRNRNVAHKSAFNLPRAELEKALAIFAS